MYLKLTNFYYKGTDVHCCRGPFLLLLQDKDQECGPDNFRAIVREVALRQLGHWMMGTARIKGQSISVSGGYGGDGLPVRVTKEIFDQGVPVPRELYDAWAHGEGWNSAGKEWELMKAWALKEFNID